MKSTHTEQTTHTVLGRIGRQSLEEFAACNGAVRAASYWNWRSWRESW
jgi:hypothetical protein